MLQQDNIVNIEYTKDNGDKSKRYIIPTCVPKKSIKAIDVSDLTEDQRDEMCKLHAEYNQYREQAIKNIFNFEDWVSQTSGNDLGNIKWRTFNIDNISFV